MKTLFSIFLPPVGIAMKGGSATSIIINLVLCCLGVIPGIIHALIFNTRHKATQVIINNNSQ